MGIYPRRSGISGHGEYMKKRQFKILITEELYQQVREEAFKRNLSLGEFTRRALEAQLKESQG